MGGVGAPASVSLRCFLQCINVHAGRKHPQGHTWALRCGVYMLLPTMSVLAGHGLTSASDREAALQMSICLPLFCESSDSAVMSV